MACAWLFQVVEPQVLPISARSTVLTGLPADVDVLVKVEALPMASPAEPGTGVAAEGVVVRALHPPPPPTDVEAELLDPEEGGGAAAPTAVARRAARITFKAVAPGAGEGAVSHYHIRSSPARGFAMVDAPEEGSDGNLEAEIRDLSPGVAYTFTVQAMSAVGVGKPSSPSSPPIVPIGVPRAPAGVDARARLPREEELAAAAEGLGAKVVDVSWSAPVNTGGAALTQFNVRCAGTKCSCDAGDEEGRGSVGAGAGVTVGADIKQTTFTTLAPGERHIFVVTASNAAGFTSEPSVPSRAVVVYGAPSGAPRGLVLHPGVDRAFVTFMAPAAGRADPPIAAYDVEVVHRACADESCRICAEWKTAKEEAAKRAGSQPAKDDSEDAADGAAGAAGESSEGAAGGSDATEASGSEKARGAAAAVKTPKSALHTERVRWNLEHPSGFPVRFQVGPLQPDVTYGISVRAVGEGGLVGPACAAVATVTGTLGARLAQLNCDAATCVKLTEAHAVKTFDDVLALSEEQLAAAGVKASDVKRIQAARPKPKPGFFASLPWKLILQGIVAVVLVVLVAHFWYDAFGAAGYAGESAPIQPLAGDAGTVPEGADVGGIADEGDLFADVVFVADEAGADGADVLETAAAEAVAPAPAGSDVVDAPAVEAAAGDESGAASEL